MLFSALSVLWGIPYLLIKVALEDLSPALIVFGRTAIAALLLVPLAVRRGELRPVLPMWRLVAVFAAIEICIPWLLLGEAEQSLTSSLAGLLVAAVPLVTAVLTPLFGGTDRLDRTRLLGLGVGMVGVATLLGLDLGGELVAGLEMGLVVVCYATGPLVIDKYFGDLPARGVMACAFLMSVVAYTPTAAVSWPTSRPSAASLWSVVALAVLCTVVAFLVLFALIAEVGPNRATVITFVNPAVAVLLGVVLRGEPFTVGIAVGFPLVLVGCWLATRKAAPEPVGERMPAAATMER